MTSFRDLLRSLPFLIAAATFACQGDTLIEPSLGTLEISTATGGPEPDPDGYTVRVDTDPVQPIAPIGLVRTGALEGQHSVMLEGVAANCAVEGENPRQVTVPAGDTTLVGFTVLCSSTLGGVIVSATTIGSFPDPDGYVVTIDGGTSRSFRGEAGVTFSNLSPGSHSVELSGVAANCRLQGPNPRTGEITTGNSTVLNFEIDCSKAPAIAFTRRTDDGSNVYLSSVYLVNPDGSGLVRLTPGSYAVHPAWSPDGGKIAFVSSGDLSVINADGTGLIKLFHAADPGLGAIRWSPDGETIAFEVLITAICDGREYCDQPQLWVIHPDGTGLQKLADGGSPAWSADGRKIAFLSQNAVTYSQIYTIDPGGSGRTQVTSLALGTGAPTWSPDGVRLAFAGTTDWNSTRIFTIKTDGSGMVGISPEVGTDYGPRWSPDGTRIAFQTSTASGWSLAVMNADGSARSTLTGQGSVTDFTWSPDASKVAYTLLIDNGPSLRGDFEVYVVNADGTGVVDVSRSPFYDSEPSWSAR